MIKKTFKIILGLFFLSVAGSTLTNAQIPDHTVIKADIPFSFILRDKTFPAGAYTLRQTPADADSEFTLEIIGATGHSKSMVFETSGTDEKNSAMESSLVFDKIGGRYFLSKIFAADSAEGNEVPKSKIEKNLERDKLNIEKYVLKVGHWGKIEKKEERKAEKEPHR
jgi:hypothetical protein